MATEISWISALPNSWSRCISKLFNTLPRKGNIAWVFLSRANFADPPAESPSTRNNSLSRISSLSQSVNLPGRTATPDPFFFSIFLVERMRICACRMANSAIFLPISIFWFNHNSSGSIDMLATSFKASRLVSLSFVCPWNCGSSKRADNTKAMREKTSSDCSLTPRGNKLWWLMKLLTAWKTACFNPASWVPPSGVGIRLT